MKRFTCLCFFIAIGLIFTASVNARIDPNAVVGAWLLDDDDDETAEDVSGNEHHGTLEGDPEWVDGVFGMALSFNGTSSRIVIPDADSLDLEEEWTISAWVFVNESESTYGHILGKRVDVNTNANYCFRVDASASGWEAYYMRGGAWQGIWNQGAVSKDEWLYMTATYTPEGAGTITIYENAVEIGSGNFGDPAPAGVADVNIGGFSANSTELIDGILDEVVLLSVALEVSDIENLMDNGIERALGFSPVKPSGKLASTWGRIRVNSR